MYLLPAKFPANLVKVHALTARHEVGTPRPGVADCRRRHAAIGLTVVKPHETDFLVALVDLVNLHSDERTPAVVGANMPVLQKIF